MLQIEKNVLVLMVGKRGNDMKRNLFVFCILVLFVGCSKPISPYTITVKLIPLGKSDGKIKNIVRKIDTNNRKAEEVDISEWKNIKILYNEFEKEIKLKNPNFNNREIIIPRGEGVLVSNILEVLAFRNEREFFNSLKKKVLDLNYPLVIYHYQEKKKDSDGNEEGKKKNVYFKHIYGIAIPNISEMKNITRKVGVN